MLRTVFDNGPNPYSTVASKGILEVGALHSTLEPRNRWEYCHSETGSWEERQVSCAYAFSPSEIRQIFQRCPLKASRLWQLAERANGLAAIFQRSPSKASRLWQLAERANGLAATIEERWGELSEEQRELLADFAYEAIDPPSDMRSKLQAFLSCCYGAWVILQGKQDALVAYASASDRLVDAIIRANERDSYKTMTAEEACEWIREISDRAIR